MALAKKDLLRQEKTFAGALSRANPLGDLFFVDSVNGNNGNDGRSRLHPVASLVQALTLAAAGDTILLVPRGSETLTATSTISLAGLKVLCPVDNPESGYTLTGAGTVDLLTVSAADVHVEGLRFTRTAGAGSTTAGLLTTAAADRLTARKCSFDYRALTSAWTNYGIELTDDITDVLIEECRFRDCHRGVLGAVATAKDASNWQIKDCDFWVGQSTAFGVYCQPAGTGTLQGIQMHRCTFFEADGDGTVATDTWDGTNGTDATSGPINFSAAVDRWMTADCRAYSARDILFSNLNAIAAGAAGEHVDSFSHQSQDVSAVSSDTAHIESDAVRIESMAVVIKSDTSDILSDTTIATSDTAHIESDAVRIESMAVVIKSDTSDILSDTTIATSDTAHIESDAARIESDQLLMTPGYGVAKVIVIADNAIPNNSQAAGGLICTATGGAVWIEDIVVEKDGTAMTGPTNLELTTDNVYGSTGAATPVSLKAITSLGGNGRYSALADSFTERIPFVLASGKKLYVHGDDAAGTSLGNTQFAVIGRALADGATLT